MAISAVLSLALSVITHAQASGLLQAPAQKGDLAVYSLGYGSSDAQTPGATMMLLLDPSLGNYQAGRLQLNSQNKRQDEKQLLEQMQQALVYLMDTPNLLADNLQLGIGQMVGGKWRYVAAHKLGPVLYSNQPSSQRYKIKHFILKNQCQTVTSCQSQRSALSPLSAFDKSALAYAEVGAYMLGSSTGLVQDGQQLYQIDRQKLTQIAGMPQGQMPYVNDIHSANVKDNTKGHTNTKANPFATATRYAAPLYNQCSAKKYTSQSYQTQGQDRQSKAKHEIGNAIVIITTTDMAHQSSSTASVIPSQSHQEAVLPVQADSRDRMNQSLSLANSGLANSGLDNTANTIKTPITKSRCAVAKLGLPVTQADTSTTNTSPDSLLSNWGCIGQYAQQLRQTLIAAVAAESGGSTPAYLSLQTGIIAFTPKGNALPATTLPPSSLLSKPSTPESLRQHAGQISSKGYNCQAARSERQRNLCLLGQAGAGYGEGGYTQLLYDAQDNSPETQQLLVNKLVTTLVQMSHQLRPQAHKVGSPAPLRLANPLLKGQVFATSYMSSIYPQLGSLQAQWPGNLRRHQSVKNSQSVKHSQTGDSSNSHRTHNDSKLGQVRVKSTNDGSRDSTYVSNGKGVRNVYISRPDAGVLARYSKDTIDKLTLTNLSTQQNRQLRQLMLQYMGLTIATPTDNSLVPSMSLGAIHHSTPIMLVAKAGRQQQNIEQYKKYLLYGAMDNALHLIDDDTGEEILSYFPQAVLAHNQQYQAISSQQLNSTNQATPSFGVDAPWVSYANYRLDDNRDSIASELYAFGGAGLGAQAYYGIDFTGLDKVESATQLNGFAPKQLFTITPDRLDFARPYFQQLGYSWAKPVIGRINWQGKSTLVVILSGGYDAATYDKTDGRQRHISAMNVGLNRGRTDKGNAVYIVDAKTGTPLIVINHAPVSKRQSNSVSITAIEDSNGFVSGSLNKVLQVSSPYLQNSIIGSVKALDRDADVLIDHLYFVDIQGQVFRVDIDNLASSASVSSKVRVLRLADLKNEGQADIGDKAGNLSSSFSNNNNKSHNSNNSNNSSGNSNSRNNTRFYESPVVALHKEGEHHFASISVASGNQSNLLRITDPTQDTVALEVVYTDKSGAQQRVRAWRKNATQPWRIHHSQSLTTTQNQRLSSLSQQLNIKNNRLRIPANLRQSGTLVVATATFVSTEQVSSQAVDLNINSQTETMIDPLAPKISFAQGMVVIELMTTQQLSPADTAPNYVYTLYDKDVTRAGLFETTKADLQTQHVPLSKALFPDISQIEVDNHKNSGYHYQGWRAPLRVSSDHSVKAKGALAIVANKLFVTGYNPRVSQLDPAGCQAQVVGATEVFQFCLPYGRCYHQYRSRNGKSNQNHIRHEFYGKGIRSLTWLTDRQGRQRQLLMPNMPFTMLRPNQREKSNHVTNQRRLTNRSHRSILGAPEIEIEPDNETSILETRFKVVPKLTPFQWFDYGNHVYIRDGR